MSDGVGTSGASHASLQWFPALLGRQIPQAQVSKHCTWEVVAGDRARWAQPAGSFLFALLLILEPVCLPVYSCIQAQCWRQFTAAATVMESYGGTLTLKFKR